MAIQSLLTLDLGEVRATIIVGMTPWQVKDYMDKHATESLGEANLRLEELVRELAKRVEIM